jgi:hypothetical protein
LHRAEAEAALGASNLKEVNFAIYATAIDGEAE